MNESNFDFKNIPIFIISYNRKEVLQRCIERFQGDGYKNLIVIDNASTDKELLSYLKSLDIKIFFLNKNYGHHVLWDCGLFDDIIKKQYFVLTDPDILPIEECPTDYILQFYRILQLYPEKIKVGFSLKLDDLPETYKYKYDIIRFESFYWEKKIKYEFPIYDAPIDTTFALYRPLGGYDYKTFYDGIRTGYPYIARHLGWYIDNFSQEDYYSQAKNEFSTSLNDNAMDDFRRNVIGQLSLRQSLSIYPMIKDIYTINYIKKHASWFSVLQCVLYLLLKKMAVFIGVK